MNKSELEKEFRNRFPEFVNNAIIEYDRDDHCLITLPFLRNKKFSVWISDEDGFMVGINELHNHFDLADHKTNSEEAFSELMKIIRGRRVAIIFKKEPNTIQAIDNISDVRELINDPSYSIITYEGINE